MNRDVSLKNLSRTDQWDIIIIGGGASGLGAAVDAARRGYKTLLLEKNDFAKGTSSRSTQLTVVGNDTGATTSITVKNSVILGTAMDPSIFG